jgi:glutaminyl-peptide cyclotransferase
MNKRYFSTPTLSRWLCGLMMAASLSACENEDANTTHSSESTVAETRSSIQKPDFRPDTAYAYIARQLSFGARVPGTKAQIECANWIQQLLTASCDTVYRQEATVKAGNGKPLPCINIIGSINPEAKQRILFLTHWDSRPWADRDHSRSEEPILAADDGASGTAVLLELASRIQSQALPSSLGIDFLFCDVEDYGRSEWGENSYSLGTQYWAKKPHIPGYKASFGILLDMVGARDARFRMEGYSSEYAPDVLRNVWSTAARAGFSSYFLYEYGGYITDDHYFVNKLTGIPTINIINLSRNPESPFASHWHTHNDNMDIIDKNTLEAVGETLLQLIYEMASTH